MSYLSCTFEVRILEGDASSMGYVLSMDQYVHLSSELSIYLFTVFLPAVYLFVYYLSIIRL